VFGGASVLASVSIPLIGDFDVRDERGEDHIDIFIPLAREEGGVGVGVGDGGGEGAGGEEAEGEVGEERGLHFFRSFVGKLKCLLDLKMEISGRGCCYCLDGLLAAGWGEDESFEEASGGGFYTFFFLPSPPVCGISYTNSSGYVGDTEK
jgi:hypothetical protein